MSLKNETSHSIRLVNANKNFASMKEQESHCLKITDKSLIFKCFEFSRQKFHNSKNRFHSSKNRFHSSKNRFHSSINKFHSSKKRFSNTVLESSSLTLTVHSSVAWSCYVGNYQRSQLHESAKKYMLDVISLVKKL